MPTTDLPGLPDPAELAAAARAGLTLRQYRAREAERARTPAIDPDAIEKDEQREVVKMYRAHGCLVRNLSQARRTKQAPGLPDLWIVHRGKAKAWWMEVKRQAGGRLSPGQIEFQEDCRLCGVGHLVGGVREAMVYLEGIGVPIDENLRRLYGR